MIDCPVCERKNIEDSKCPQCSTDLTSLLRLRELPEAYYVEGVRLAEQGELDKAIENLTTAISLNSTFTASYLTLGNIYTQKKLYNEAIAQYQKALEIEPENDEVKKAKEETEKTREKSKEAEAQEIHRTAILKKLLIGIPVVAFFIGMVILPITENLFNQKVDYSAIVKQIKNNIANYSALADLTIDVSYTDDSFNISGNVPTDLHKSLVEEVARNAARDNLINTQGLLISLVHEKEPEFLYTVKHNDTLTLIAYRFYNDSRMWNKIYEVNRDKISNRHKIFVGQILSIPVK